MLTVNKCLCFELEKGGKLFGWFHYIVSLVTACGALLFALAVWTSNCDEILDFIQHNYRQQEEQSCTSFRIVVTVICIVAIPFFTVSAFVHRKLIFGIEMHDHRLLKPAMVVEAILLIVLVLETLLFLKSLVIIINLVLIVVLVYCFIVLYSVYYKIEGEKSSADTVYTGLSTNISD